MALNDESGTVRALAVAVAGRLASLNPAYIMPALRKHLMQLLSDMALSPDSKQREGVHFALSVPVAASLLQVTWNPWCSLCSVPKAGNANFAFV